jgi:hypothetical protein
MDAIRGLEITSMMAAAPPSVHGTDERRLQGWWVHLAEGTPAIRMQAAEQLARHYPSMKERLMAVAFTGGTGK